MHSGALFSSEEEDGMDEIHHLLGNKLGLSVCSGGMYLKTHGNDRNMSLGDN